MIEPQLMRVTLQLLTNRPRSLSYATVCSDTGIPHAWLSSFARGIIVDPSVNRVEVLYTYLSGKCLNV